MQGYDILHKGWQIWAQACARKIYSSAICLGATRQMQGSECYTYYNDIDKWPTLVNIK